MEPCTAQLRHRIHILSSTLPSFFLFVDQGHAEIADCRTSCRSDMASWKAGPKSVKSEESGQARAGHCPGQGQWTGSLRRGFSEEIFVDLRGLTGTDSSIQHADRALSQSEARRTKSCKNVSAACASLSSAPLESLEETTRQARAFCAHLRSTSSSPQWRSCKLPHFTGDCRARCLSSLSLSTALSRIAHFTEKV